MISFHPITLDDRPTIERYTMAAELQNCDWAFANIYCWQGLYGSECAEWEGMLFIRFHIDGGSQLAYMQPLGEVNWEQAISLLQADAAQQGQPLRLVGLTPTAQEALQTLDTVQFAYDSERAMCDYVYRREDLCSLRGKHYQPKRNHLNRFRNTYPNYRYEPLAEHHFEACMELVQAWCRQHDGCQGAALQAELEAMQRAFAHFEALGLQGGCLYVEEALAAFTYGSAVSHDTFVIHIEKADTRYEGAFTMINHAFACALDERYCWINREEDLGLEGLRKAKLSYYPSHLVEKIAARALSEEAVACRRLWQVCFPSDEASFVDKFLIRHFSPARMLAIRHEQEVVAMAHLIPFRCQWGTIGYLYGVATVPEHMGKGLATTLIQQAIDRATEEGMAAVVLIPGYVSLRHFYAKRGFVGELPIRLLAPYEFDFGTGETTRDIAMWHFCGPEQPLPELLPCQLILDE